MATIRHWLALYVGIVILFATTWAVTFKPITRSVALVNVTWPNRTRGALLECDWYHSGFNIMSALGLSVRFHIIGMVNCCRPSQTPLPLFHLLLLEKLQIPRYPPFLPHKEVFDESVLQVVELTLANSGRIDLSFVAQNPDFAGNFPHGSLFEIAHAQLARPLPSPPESPPTNISEPPVTTTWENSRAARNLNVQIEKLNKR